MALLGKQYIGRMASGLFYGLSGCLLLLLLAAQAPPAKDTSFSEQDIKAAFLVNFAKYVEWPSDAFENEDSPIEIGIYGSNPFGDTLEQLAAERGEGQRKLSIRTDEKLESLRNCHIVFFSGESQVSHEQALDTLEGKAVLTVGEQKGFLDRGGAINFVLSETKVKFEINLKSAKKNKLKISSQLLKIAIKVLK